MQEQVGSAQISSLALSPDGKKLLFSHLQFNSENRNTVVIKVLNLEDILAIKKADMISADPYITQEIEFSRDTIGAGFYQGFKLMGFSPDSKKFVALHNQYVYVFEWEANKIQTSLKSYDILSAMRPIDADLLATDLETFMFGHDSKRIIVDITKSSIGSRTTQELALGLALSRLRKQYFYEIKL